VELYYFYVNGVTFKVDRVSSYRFGGWATGTLSGRHIKLRAVPGAGYDFTVQATFGQGASAMGAAIADGVKSTVNVKQRYFVPLGSDQLPFPWSQLVNLGHFNVLTHLSLGTNFTSHCSPIE
jgi:hypothetical protein